jgi:S-adenosylmethionine:tRNA ribosyltransferase-isomerase
VKTETLQYNLPPELIAQQPIRCRTRSKLLVLNRSTGKLIDSQFGKLGEFLLPGDCLVLNDTKVLPARFFAGRKSGAKLEGLFIAQEGPSIWQVMLKNARKVKSGEIIYLSSRQKNCFYPAELLEKNAEGLFRLKIDTNQKLETVLENIGFPPLPP